MNSDKRLTTGDIMRYCCVSRPTVLRWIWSRELEAYVHPHGQYRVTETAFIDFLKAHNMPINEELVRDAVQPNEAKVGLRKRIDARAGQVNPAEGKRLPPGDRI